MKICPGCSNALANDAAACDACGAEASGVERRRGDDLSGALLNGKYTLKALVGEGDMAWVYQGTQTGLDRSVAVKIMKPLNVEGENMALRFEREARLAAALSHPNIIHIFDFGDTAGGILYLVSEFLNGESLGQHIARGAKPLPQALALFAQLLDAVEEAHVHGVVHRDLKPENIVLVPLRGGGEVLKVLDFGIATLAEDPSPRLAAEGMLVGTPAFMAPELFQGNEATPGSDLYACALLLFEMLTGLPAINGANLEETIAAQRSEARPSLQRAAPEMGFSDCLERVMARALALSPAHRYQEIKELRADLNQCPDVVPHFHSALYPALPLTSPAVPVASVPVRRRHSGGVLIPAEGPLDPQARALMAGLDTSPVDVAALSLMEPRRRPSAPRHPAGGAPRTDSQKTSGSSLWQDGLVGRTRELTALEAFIQDDRSQLELTGAPGLGKSSLLRVLARRRRALEEVIWIARADPTGARAPWFPMRRLARDLLSLEAGNTAKEEIVAHARTRGLPDEDARWLAELLSPLRASSPNRPEVRHREISAALLNLMGAARQQQPCALLMDDADQYDGATLGFVRRLVAMAPTSRPALILTGASSVLNAAAHVSQLLIGPLHHLAAMELIARRAGIEDATAPGLELPRELANSQAGSPLILEEAVALHLQGGDPTGASLAGLISRRLDLLGTAERRVLTCLSILGSQAPRALLQELSGAPLQALETLIAQDLVKLTEDGADVRCHPLIAEVLHDQTPEQDHLKLHKRAFTLLRARGAGTFTLVRHTVEGALHQTSLAMLERAADEASGHLAHEEAVFFLRTAGNVARWDLHLPRNSDVVLGLRVKLGEALLAAGQHRSAGNLFSSGLEQGRPEDLLSCRMQLGLGRSLAAADRLGQARDALGQATGQALRLGDPLLISEVYLQLSQLLEANGHWRLALAEAEECFGLLADTGQGQDNFWRLQALAARCLEQLNRPEEALDMARAGLESALLHGAQEETKASAALQVGRLLLGAGAAEEGGRMLKLALDRFSSLGDRRGQAEVLLATAQGDASQRGSLARQAAILAEQVGWAKGEARADSMGEQAEPRRKHHSFD